MMLNNLTTSIQLETIFSLLLNKRTEKQMVKATGYPLSTVRYLIKANRKRFEERLYRHRKKLFAKKQHEDHVRVCEHMIDTIRVEVLKQDPLYEDSKPEIAECSHVRAAIVKAMQPKKQKQFRKKRQPISILEHMLNHGNRQSN